MSSINLQIQNIAGTKLRCVDVELELPEFTVRMSVAQSQKAVDVKAALFAEAKERMGSLKEEQREKARATQVHKSLPTLPPTSKSSTSESPAAKMAAKNFSGLSKLENDRNDDDDEEEEEDEDDDDEESNSDSGASSSADDDRDQEQGQDQDEKQQDDGHDDKELSSTSAPTLIFPGDSAKDGDENDVRALSKAKGSAVAASAPVLGKGRSKKKKKRRNRSQSSKKHGKRSGGKRLSSKQRTLKRKRRVASTTAKRVEKEPPAPLQTSADCYVLKFVGVSAIVDSENAELRRNPVVQICNKVFVRPVLVMVVRAPAAAQSLLGVGSPKAELHSRLLATPSSMDSGSAISFGRTPLIGSGRIVSPRKEGDKDDDEDAAAAASNLSGSGWMRARSATEALPSRPAASAPLLTIGRASPTHAFGASSLLSSAANSPSQASPMLQRATSTVMSDLNLADDARLHITIAKMIAGDDYKEFLECYLMTDDDDVVVPRRLLAIWRLRRLRADRAHAAATSGGSSEQLLPMSIHGEPRPHRASVPEKIWFSATLPVVDSQSLILIDSKATVDQLREACYAKSRRYFGRDTNSAGVSQPSDFVMKAPKYQEYLANDKRSSSRRLLDFDYIRRSLSNNFGRGNKTPIEIVFVPKVTLNPALQRADVLSHYPVSAIDQLLAHEHAWHSRIEYKERIALMRRELIESAPRVANIYNFTKTFIVRVDAAENVMCTSPNDVFFVMAEIYHSGRRVTAPAYTSCMSPPASLFAALIDDDGDDSTSATSSSAGSVSQTFDEDAAALSPPPQSSTSASSSFRRRHHLRNSRAETRSPLARFGRIEWNQWIEFKGFRVQDVPDGARICMTLYRRSSSKAAKSGVAVEKLFKNDKPLGWMARQLVTRFGTLRAGFAACHLWPNERANPAGTCADNRRNLATFRSLIQFIGEDKLQSVAARSSAGGGKVRSGGGGLRSRLKTGSSASASAASFGSVGELRGGGGDDGAQLGDQVASSFSDSPPPMVLHIEFYQRTLVVFPDDDSQVPPSMYVQDQPSPVELSRHKSILRRLFRSDPLRLLTPADRILLWRFRGYCVTRPEALAKFMRAVSWENHHQVIEAHRLLKLWSPPTPMQALELLGERFSDPKLRAYAVKLLDAELSDLDVENIILQLTQALKYEHRHDSALAHFLLGRAARCSKLGQSFFWLLKVELDQPDVAERYTLLLESYLRSAGPKRAQLQLQVRVLDDLLDVARRLKEAPVSERDDVLRTGLSAIRVPECFEMPLDQRWQACGINVDRCKYMDSKMVPLWLNFQNIDRVGPPNPHIIILKVGDDLRQDALTLQVIRLMDRFWKQEGLDLRLRPYGCVATGDFTGMIEVVLDSNTCAKINNADGGAKANFQASTLTRWLQAKNPTPDMWARAQENFKLSCAGYCVATYVIGIGDRHNDNIMMTERGHLFHIDFGHFLGHYKKKLGVERERAPFIFTPQFAHILDGSSSATYSEFVSIACRAYNILRRHGNTFMNLFLLMLQAGIPELQSVSNIAHLREKLQLHLSTEAAAASFERMITKSRKSIFTTLDHSIHCFVRN
jgi:Phosphatidylinositol 3- and 4-kinase/Phosphoinositide 3-kinase family, accessory domain (PIK domain)/Phosphoinositide 3-kinase C2